MESENNIIHSEKGGINKKTVTDRSKGNKLKKKNISQEPEMIELKKLLKQGKVDPDRLNNYLNDQANDK